LWRDWQVRDFPGLPTRYFKMIMERLPMLLPIQLRCQLVRIYLTREA
jgi:hypothetical protein